MASRLGRAALWAAAGFLLGFAALAGGEGEEDLREKLIELERLSAQLRALESERAEVPVANDQGMEFDIIHVRDLTVGVTEFTRPYRIERNEEPGISSGPDEEAPQPYGTIEEVIELIRTRVRPDAWENGSNIAAQGGSIVLLAPPDLNRAVREFLDRELRPDVRRTVNLQVEIVEADGGMATALGTAVGGAIDGEQRARLDESIAAGKSRRLFGGRLRALSRQRAVLWHGAQVARVSEVDVDKKTGAADPVVEVDLLGAIVQVRSTVVEERVRVQISFDQSVSDGPVRVAGRELALRRSTASRRRRCCAATAGA